MRRPYAPLTVMTKTSFTKPRYLATSPQGVSPRSLAVTPSPSRLTSPDRSTLAMVQTPTHEILRYLREHLQEMLDFLQQLVLIETPSTVPQTHQAQFSLLADAFSRLDYHVRHIPGRITGGHLFARPRQRPPQTPLQLLLGHAD